MAWNLYCHVYFIVYTVINTFPDEIIAVAVVASTAAKILLSS